MATSIAESVLLDEIKTHMVEAQDARREFKRASAEYRTLLHREMELVDNRHVEKQAAALRLKEQVNPLTDPKLHSGSSAEEYAATDQRYAAHLQALRDVVTDKLTAQAWMEDARMRERLALAAIHVLLGSPQ